MAVWGVATLFVTGCGPKAFTKGEYDDPTRVELLDDRFNEADMQQMADSTVQEMTTCAEVAQAKKPPVVILERVQNRTEEHLDMVSIMNKVRTALIRSKKFKFANKEERGTLDDEYRHSESGAVSAESLRKRGRQVGADHILSGELSTNIQQVGNDKLIYYKLTLNLTGVETSVIDCVAEKEIRKKYRKRSVGL